MFLNILNAFFHQNNYYEADINLIGIIKEFQKLLFRSGLTIPVTLILNLVFTIFAPKARIFGDPMSEN